MPNYVSKINVNNSTYSIGGDNFDGQWVKSALALLSNVTLSGGKYYTYSLSNYLPNDSYDYEVIFSGDSTSTASSGKVCQLTLFSGTTTSDTAGWRLNRCQARTDATVTAGGVARIPILKSDRNVTVFTQDCTTNNTGTYLTCCGYRRIGKNGSSSSYIRNINSYPIGGVNFNGSNIIFTTDRSGTVAGGTEHNLLFTDATLTTSALYARYSVSSIIPNDGYDYELCISVWSRPPETKGNYSNLQVIQGTYTTRPEYSLKVGGRRARTAADYQDFKTVWLPISANDKYITFFNIGNSTVTYNCMVHGYRRIGTNA